jgi:hypothetical protein
MSAYLFSANGAAFISAWGNAPGIRCNIKRSALKARFNPARWRLIRAFSAAQ